MSKAADTVDAQNAAVLAELVVDPLTTDHTRVQILNMLLSTGDQKDFFEAMFKNNLSQGSCVKCGHMNHWLIPEDKLNEFGWVTANKDPRAPMNPTAKDCEEFQESCPKKKVNA